MARRGENKKRQLEQNLARYGADIVRMYVAEALSYAAIASVIGVSAAAVGQWLKILDIPARPADRCGSKNGRYKNGDETRLHLRLVTRDVCNRCGDTEQLLVHHVDGDHFNNAISNLEVLCNHCHSRHHKLAYWAAQPKKSVCVHGDRLVEGNVYVNKLGHRSCKTCRAATSLRAEARRPRRVR